MLPRDKRSVLTAVLVLALLFTAAPGWAAQRRSPAISGWGGFWQRVVAWITEKTGSVLTAAPSGTVKSDTTVMIDPNGHH